MKLKGVNPIEQHIEKIVLGLMLVLLLGVIAMQFVTQPNVVKDGSRVVTPAQVYTALEPQANQLQSQISDLSPSLPDVQPVDLIERYNDAFANSGATRLALSSPLGSGVDIARATGTQIADIERPQSGPIQALMVPATSTPIAASQWATLDPYAVQAVPAYSDFVPAQQPYDFASISIEATFSGTDLEEALTGSNAIPRRFWSATGIAILGFEAERQRLMPDGSWGTSEPIRVPPRTSVPTNAIGNDAGLQDLVTVVSNASRSIDDVARPMFPPTIAGPGWVPPSERVDMGDSSQADKIRRVQRQLERARADLERLNNPGQTRNPGGGGKTSNPRDPRNTQDPRNPARPGQDNSSRAEKLRERITELEKQLEDLGVNEDDTATVRIRTSANDVRSVLEEETIELWAHDLGVEPGATYRYRTRVAVNNPLFRKGAELDPDDADQQSLAQNPFAYGEWSGWSEPVVAGAREYYFVTSSDLGAANSAAGPKATVELYQMYYGHYRKSTLSVSPGDMLATTVRVSGDLLAFDTSIIDVAQATEVVNGLQAEDSQGALPVGVSELANRVNIDLGVFVLDIYQGQEQTKAGLGGQRTSVIRVVLRDADGQVIVRSEQGDESSLAYALASESAAAATTTPLRTPGEPASSPSAELFDPIKP